MYLKKDDLDVTFCRFCIRKHNCCIRYYNLNFKVRWLARKKVTWFLLCSLVYDLRAYITTIKTTKAIITRCPLINLRFGIKVVLLCFIEGSSEAKYFLREPDNTKTKNIKIWSVSKRLSITTNLVLRARNFNLLWLRNADWNQCQERCVTKGTTAAKWTRCFLIGMNDLIWRMLAHYLLNMQRWFPLKLTGTYAKILRKKSLLTLNCCAIQSVKVTTELSADPDHIFFS